MIKRIAFKAVSKLLLQPLYRQIQGMTLGTRTAIFNGAGEVLLVRHSYAPGWMLPGGGVSRGETVFAAAVREVREETGIIAEEEPVLHGIFLNDRQFPGDHVACFVLRQFSQQAGVKSVEIAEFRFFPVTEMPPDTSGGTRRRIAEIMSGGPVPHDW